MEDKKHELAYQYYKSLGSDRSLAKVADLIGLSEKTIRKWSAQDKWLDRLNSEYGSLAESIKAKREKLEDLGIEVALLAVGRIKEDVGNGATLTKDLAAVYKDFLSTPLSLIGKGETVGTQPKGVNEQVKKRKEVIFYKDGEPERDKDLAGVPVYDENNIYLNRLIPKIYNDYVWNVLFNKNCSKTEFVLKGGRNSVKSTVNAILYALTLYMGLGDATASRLTYGKLRGSCFSAITKQIKKMGIKEHFTYSEKPNSPLQIDCDNGFVGYFFGLDDEQKIRSFEPKNGTHFNWVEEIQVVKKFSDLSNLKATLLRYNYNPIMTYSTNPRPEKSWWTNVELIKPSDHKYILHTTYLDIPEWWISDELFRTIEDYKTYYPELYRNLYLGEVCGGVGLVFRKIKEFKADKTQYKTLLRGLDFGLARDGDPSAYVVTALDTAKKELYILDEWFKKDTDYPEIAKAIKAENVHDFTVFCDSADAGGIKQLNIEGVHRAIQCKKTRVDTGIKYLQGLTIYIDPSATPNVYREFTEYSYVENSKGDSVLSEKNNHTIDAVRYALSDYIEGKKR